LCISRRGGEGALESVETSGVAETRVEAVATAELAKFFDNRCDGCDNNGAP
jgi:hypothetical protein